MNQEAKFQHIWEFRRKDHDGDSSDDSETNPIDKKPKPDVVLLDNDEVTDTPAPQKHHINNVQTMEKKRPLEPVKKKRKPNRKEDVVKNKSKKRCLVKEQKKGKKLIKLDDTKEIGMFDDLKNYANSLINELKVARENMFAQMNKAITKIVSSRSRKKRVMRSNQKNKTPPHNGFQSNVKSAKYPHGKIEERNKNNKVTKQDQVPEFKMANKKPFEIERGKFLMNNYMHTTKDGNQIVSSQYSTHPTVVPKLHSQSHREIIHLDGCAPDNIDAPLVKQTSPRYYYYQGVPVTQSGQFRGSNMSSKPFGLSDHNNSQMTSESVGFKVPMNRELGSGTNECSNLSSQTCSDNVVQDKNGLRMSITRFRDGGSGSSSSEIQRNCMSNNDQKNAAFWSQEMKGQLYPGFINKQ